MALCLKPLENLATQQACSKKLGPSLFLERSPLSFHTGLFCPYFSLAYLVLITLNCLKVFCSLDVVCSTIFLLCHKSVPKVPVLVPLFCPAPHSHSMAHARLRSIAKLPPNLTSRGHSDAVDLFCKVPRLKLI